MKPLSPSSTRWLHTLALAILPWLAFWPCLNGVYIWDDNLWLLSNQAVHDRNLSDIWFHPTHLPNYYPLVFTTFSLEWALWGPGHLDPQGILHGVGYHVDNLLLHTLAALSLFEIIRRLKLRGSGSGGGGVFAAFLAAALWAIHPTSLESVAWVTERKNVLCAALLFPAFLFSLQSLGLFPDYPSGKSRDYFLGLLFFLLSLFAKTAGCFLPPALLVLIWFKRGRISRRELLLSLPFFAVALIMAAFTIWVEHQHAGASGPQWNFSALQRLAIAGNALWFYVGKLLFPFPILEIYPRFPIHAGQPTPAFLFLAPIAWIVLLILAFALRKRIGRAPLAAILLFSGALFPILGFISFYTEIFTFVADHYQYLAAPILIAFIVELAALALRKFAAVLARRKADPRMIQFVTAALSGGTLLALGFISCGSAALYLSEESLWGYNLLHNPNSSVLATMYARSIMKPGNDSRDIEAILRRAIALNPDDYRPWEALADLYARLDRLDLAREALRQAESRLSPFERWTRTFAFVAAPLRPGRQLELAGKWDDALAFYDAWLLSHPSDPNALLRRAYCLQAGKNNPAAALAIAQQVTQSHPDSADAWLCLGSALGALNRPQESLDAFQKARSLDPTALLRHPELDSSPQDHLP